MRNISRLRGLSPSSFVLLAPIARVPSDYTNVLHDPDQYSYWLRKAQTLRGQTYLEDGAVDAKCLEDDGRLASPWDLKSWHVIAREGEHACATMRFTFHRRRVAPEDLGLAHSSVFQSANAMRALRAVESYQKACLDAGDIFGEVGGWASRSACRGGRKSAAVVLSAWPLCRSLGRVRALSTVTSRNRSIEILTRMAAVPLGDELGQLAPWFDDRYRCEMHLSVLTSFHLNEEFETDARELAQVLYGSPVFTK